MPNALVVFCGLLVLVSAQMDHYGDPMTQYEPQAFLDANNYCGLGKCTYGTSPLPSGPEARRLLTLFNSARTDPILWRKQFLGWVNYNKILVNAMPVPPIHSWYTLVLTAQSQADAIARFSPASCTPPDTVQVERCGWDADFFLSHGLDPVADQTCEPNLEPFNSTYSVCCFRLADCENSLIQSEQRAVLNGFPWSDCSLYPSEIQLKPGETLCGGHASFLTANTGDELATVLWFLCDDTDLDNICNVDCTPATADDPCPNANDPASPGAPDRRNILDFQQLLGGGGYRRCADCEYPEYWTLSTGYMTMPQFRPTYPIATAEYLRTGVDGQSGFMLSYWNRVPGATAPGGLVYVYSYVTGVDDLVVTKLSPLAASSPTYWAAHSLPTTGACTTYFFAVVNDDLLTKQRTGFSIARYPENGNFQYGSACAADADDYVAVPGGQGGDSCDDGQNHCQQGGVCFDDTTCVQFGESSVCTAAAPCTAPLACCQSSSDLFCCDESKQCSADLTSCVIAAPPQPSRSPSVSGLPSAFVTIVAVLGPDENVPTRCEPVVSALLGFAPSSPLGSCVSLPYLSFSFLVTEAADAPGLLHVQRCARDDCTTNCSDIAAEAVPGSCLQTTDAFFSGNIGVLVHTEYAGWSALNLFAGDLCDASRQIGPPTDTIHDSPFLFPSGPASNVSINTAIQTLVAIRTSRKDVVFFNTQCTPTCFTNWGSFEITTTQCQSVTRVKNIFSMLPDKSSSWLNATSAAHGGPNICGWLLGLLSLIQLIISTQG